MQTFENPANGHQETVSGLAGVWVLLFGLFYWAIKGLWRHFAVDAMVIVLSAAAAGGPGVLLAVPLCRIVYAFLTPSILANDYLRRGWRQFDGSPRPDEIAPSVLEARAKREAASRPTTAAPAIAAAAPVGSVAQDLERLAALLDRELITREQFEQQKARLLS